MALRKRILASAVFAIAGAGFAHSADIGLAKTPAPIQADTRCAALGEHYFPVANSNACIKISGYVSGGIDFAPKGRLTNDRDLFPNTGSGGFADLGVAGDVRFDTGYGPAQISIGVGHHNNNP